jgi:hypothetical protein
MWIFQTNRQLGDHGELFGDVRAVHLDQHCDILFCDLVFVYPKVL